MVTEYEKSAQVRGKEITAHVLRTDCGVQILLAGGDKPHIGAAAIADTVGNVTVHTFAGHREDGIARTWAEKLYSCLNVPIVVSVGIHYDGITRQEITEVLSAADRLLEEVINGYPCAE